MKLQAATGMYLEEQAGCVNWIEQVQSPVAACSDATSEGEQEGAWQPARRAAAGGPPLTPPAAAQHGADPGGVCTVARGDSHGKNRTAGFPFRSRCIANPWAQSCVCCQGLAAVMKKLG